MKKRWIVGGVLVILLGVSGTGLAVNQTWLQGRWDASHAATDLADHLQKLTGVSAATATYDPLGLPNPTVTVSVVFAPDAPTQQWGTATAQVRAAAFGKALTGATTTVTFRESGARTDVTVDAMMFSPAAVSSEIAAWRSLRQSIGDRVSLHLGQPSDTTGTGAPVREYRVKNSTDARAIAKLWPTSLPALDPSVATVWSSPGLQVGRMPSKSMMNSLAAVADIMPLASALPGTKQTGNFAVILSAVDGYKVDIITMRSGRLTDAAPTAHMADVAQAAFSTGATEVEWQSATHGPSLTAGDCPAYTSGTKTIQTHLQDGGDNKWFAAELARLGFVFPANVHAGACWE